MDQIVAQIVAQVEGGRRTCGHRRWVGARQERYVAKVLPMTQANETEKEVLDAVSFKSLRIVAADLPIGIRASTGDCICC